MFLRRGGGLCLHHEAGKNLRLFILNIACIWQRFLCGFMMMHHKAVFKLNKRPSVKLLISLNMPFCVVLGQ